MIHTLSNGLRLAADHLPECPVEVCGVAVDAGSRDEGLHDEGLAHFVEHTLFKGTARRRSSAVNSCLESRGGELNAYTSKEETIIYGIAPRGNLSRAFDLLADLVTDARFPDEEVERERQVVADEIASYLDMPSENVFDLFEEEHYRGCPAAHNILGSEASLQALTAQDCRRWLHDFYTPGRMLLFYAGAESPERVLKAAERFFSHIDRPDNPRPLRDSLSIASPFRLRREIDSHQAHVVMGAPCGGLAAPGSIPRSLMLNILGGPGANSLLNSALREKRGLVYSVDASTALLTEAGLLNIYFGCDPEDVGRCIRLVESTIRRFVEKPMSCGALRRHSRQFLGQHDVGALNVVENALGRARLRLHGIQPLSRTAIAEALDNISPLQLADAARPLLSPSILSLY